LAPGECPFSVSQGNEVMANPWDWIRALLSPSDYQDLPDESELSYQDRSTQWIHSMYPTWRSLYDASVLNTRFNASGTGSNNPLRWPTQVDLIGTYCRTYADLLWGRAQSGDDSRSLLRVRVDDRVPGMKRHTAVAQRLAEDLNLFWQAQESVLRENGVIQQWAGGAIVKVTWAYNQPGAVYGIALETVQPENFYPVFDPLNFRRMIAAMIKFDVSPMVARSKYNLTPEEINQLTKGKDVLTVTEYWDADRYAIVIGRKGEGNKGVVGRWPDGSPMEGKNWIVDPIFKAGLIPIVYIPRYLDGGFYGLSLAKMLEGVQGEYNKMLADLGDALNRSAHPSGGLHDYHGAKRGTGAGTETIPVARGALIDLGITPPGLTPTGIVQFPGPDVPEVTTAKFADLLVSSADFMAGMTDASKGSSSTAELSGVAAAAAMLPTLNTVDALRGNWNQGIASGPVPIDRIMMAMWFNKPTLAELGMLPSIKENQFKLQQFCEFRPVLPRDKAAIVDEVVRLATAKAVSPMEWLKRLGDIEDLGEEYQKLMLSLILMAQIEAASAGRELTVDLPQTARGEQMATSAESMPEVNVRDTAAQQMMGQKPGSPNIQTNTKSKGGS